LKHGVQENFQSKKYINLTKNLHRTSNSTIGPVTINVFTKGIRFCTAPWGFESSCGGAGVVDNPLIDEGKLTGGWASWGRSGCCSGNCAGVNITISIVTNDMVAICISSSTAPCLLKSSSISTACVGHTHVCEWKDTGSSCSCCADSCWCCCCCGCGCGCNYNLNWSCCGCGYWCCCCCCSCGCGGCS